MLKLHLKMFDGKRNQNVWVHFCYVTEEAANILKENADFNWKDMNALDCRIKRWLEEDFGMSVFSIDDLVIAKECIKAKYKRLYPEVFLDNEGDRQGWTRVWITSKIKGLVNK